MWGWEGDESDSGLCPVVDFDINGVEHMVSAT
jgi:hypothetical protein